MKNDNDEQLKTTLKSTIVTEDALYEMIYDKVLNTTSFIKAGRNGQMEFFLEEAKINGRKFKPLPPNHMLVEKKVILFPSMAFPYENEEKLLNEIQTFIHKYLDVTEAFEPIATYYVLFTWLYDRFNEVPYLRAIGDFGTGKSRLLQVIGSVCYKPIFTGGATTTSPIFRIVDEVKGTLVIDEADFKYSDMSSEMIKILNMGYQKGSNVLRSEGKGTFEVKAYDVFCPKIVATRETFTDKALESRFLIEEMGSGNLRKDIPRTLNDEFYFESETLRNKLLMWRLKNYFEPIEKREEVIDGIHPRLNQIVIPLLSIIKDKKIREQLIKFIIKYNGELVAERGFSQESDIVFAILKLEHEIFDGFVTTKQITDEINKDIDSSYDKLNPRKIGWYLSKKLQLKSSRTRRGFVLSFNQNRKRLDMWKERFGITDADIQGEDVNEVNVAVNGPDQSFDADIVSIPF